MAMISAYLETATLLLTRDSGRPLRRSCLPRARGFRAVGTGKLFGHLSRRVASPSFY